MLDFQRVRDKEISYQELTDHLSIDDLRDLSNEIIDTVLGLIDGASDADVIFQPVDPDADDPYAEDKDEANMAWTLGHVIVHITASSEESAFLAALVGQLYCFGLK